MAALMLWIDKDMEGAGVRSGKQGRSPSFSDAAFQFCLMIKNLYGLALRQTTGMVRSLLRLAGLELQHRDPTPETPASNADTSAMERDSPPAGRQHGDQDGGGEGEWNKHGTDYCRQWRKVHLGIDAQTLEVRVIEITAPSVGDAPMLPALLEQTPPEEALARISADGVYDTKACHAAISNGGAGARIPVRKKAQS